MKINVTITLYLEVKDAALFGGMGKVGYASSNFDFKTDDLSTIDIETVWKCTIQEYAEFLKTPEENIRIISREEYEENTEGEQ